MKTKRLKLDDNGYIVGVLPSSKPADYKTIFPAHAFTTPEELRDEYGNALYTVTVTEEEVTATGLDGEDETTTVKRVDIVPVPQTPTAEQTETVRKKTIVREIRKQYTVDDEIAELREAIVALSKGEKLPEDFLTQTENIATIQREA